MGKRSELGMLDCPYCDLTVKKVHPWQRCCGSRVCRNALIKTNKAHTRKHFGKTFTCDECGEVAPRTRSNQRFCSAEACQHVSKFGKRKPRRYVTCPHCGKRKVRKNDRQITCLSPECSYKQDRLMLLRRNPPKRTGRKKRCCFCKTKFTQLSSIHVTCNGEACAKKQKQARAEESFRLSRRRKPVLCKVCERPIKAKRFRKHPECSKQEAADKKRLNRMREGLTAQKTAAHKKSVPSARDKRTSPRMEELKCARQLQRTS